MTQKQKAVCLLSGGLDSATSLYWALKQGYEVTALTIHYGQLHAKEIQCAGKIAKALKVKHHQLSFQMPWKGSALLDKTILIPKMRDEKRMAKDIPVTYVPARNSIFLALAASCAEAIGANRIVIGANVLDYSGYPDCRPNYFRAFEKMISLGTKAGDQGGKFKILAPLLKLNKKQIVQWGARLGVPFHWTWSCYQGKSRPCKECDSCRLRAKGFREAGIQDGGG